jgi:hypothetical protein
MLTPMFGPRITTVFRSKWRALWWAVSILAGAYWAVPRPSDTANPDAHNDAEAWARPVDQQPPPAPAKHVNPWAKTPQ